MSEPKSEADMLIVIAGLSLVGKKTFFWKVLGVPEPEDGLSAGRGAVTLHIGVRTLRLDVRVLEFGSTALSDHVYEVDRIDGVFRFLPRVDGIIYILDSRMTSIGIERQRYLMTMSSIGSSGRDERTVPRVFAVSWKRRDGVYPPGTQGLFWQSQSDRPVFECNGKTGQGVMDALLALIEDIDKARAAPQLPRRYSGDPPEPRRLPVVRPDLFSAALPTWMEHLREGRSGALLADMLEAWRGCRARDLAELIDGVSYAHRTTRPAGMSHSAWIQACRQRRLEDLPWLLDTVCIWYRSHPVSAWLMDNTILERHVAQVEQRLEGLCWWMHDPRITKRLGSLLRDQTRYRRITVQRAICRVLSNHGDPRAIGLYAEVLRDVQELRPPLSYRNEALWAAVDGAMYRACDPRRDAIPGDLVVPSEHQDAWSAFAEQIRRPLPREKDMQAIAADPDNDDLRRELALAMRDRGDPRGEFILLQLDKASGSLSPEALAREEALRTTYAWDWLGPLADVVDVENCVFEKGYPVKVTVWTPSMRALRNVVGRPEWATVREMRWGGDPCWKEEAPDAELVNHPIMRSLRSVTTEMPEDPAELDALKRVAWAR